MTKHEIKVPTGISFLEDVPNFKFKRGILNKGIPGCGATTFALENKHPSIICSPRNELIKNKHAQFPNTLLVIGGVYQSDITAYLDKCTNNGNTPKILTSFDSLYKVLGCIGDKSDWQVIVDEFQCILSDSSFKSEVELRLLDGLKDLPHVTFLSATPILDKYLSKISYFDDMDYYQMDWEDKEVIEVLREKTSNPIGAAIDIVRNYQIGNYPSTFVNGKQVESTECVIFLNSVSNIVNIIKQTGLKPENVNIIVGNSPENDKLLAKIGKGFERGRIPLKDEAHKKFTFCTSTAYAGCDFYSTTASTFAISDCKRLNTSIDISTELVQIAGRQRLDANPFRRQIQFIYNTSIKEVSDEEFNEALKRKVNLTEDEIQSNNDSDGVLRQKRAKDIKRLQGINKYAESYILYDDKNDVFVFNNLAYVNEQYSYDVQRHNYQNGIVIQKQLSESGFDLLGDEESKVYNEQLKHIIKKETFEERMKNYCNYKAEEGRCFNLAAGTVLNRYPEVGHYYDLLGGEQIKALNYKECKLKDEINGRAMKSKVQHELSKQLVLPCSLSNANAKKMLQQIFDKLGMKKTAKATDFEDYCFDVKTGQKVEGKKGQRANGIRIQRIF